MFCKIKGKYYVKVANFFQELQVIDGNIIPTQGEANRIYSPVPEYKVVSSEEILKETEKKVKEKPEKDNTKNKKFF